MTFKLPDLPYAADALLPYMSEQTLNIHHGKHHKGYVDKLNAAVKGTDYEGLDLLDVVRGAHEKGDTDVFNNAAQAWNHGFFWLCMSPDRLDAPGGKLASRIEETFGSLPHLRTKFISEGMARFGSGWVWLVEESDGTLDVVSTANGGLPQAAGQKPLLTCDLWEHAYYLDYQNARQKYLEAFFDHLADWTFAAGCFEKQGDPDILAA
ncbi:MAG: superoxide dismutase [Fe] [Rhodospirillales bacterium CG15_BIG_FIL_POST_REV_8_21_14_020_66_15]|nr:MAG: superoxide dismutase [Fe] [Rhodospirillales bacterium CG15_BIG_FIL_POST_REV_8_21_14_020_66_15]